MTMTIPTMTPAPMTPPLPPPPSQAAPDAFPLLDTPPPPPPRPPGSRPGIRNVPLLPRATPSPPTPLVPSDTPSAPSQDPPLVDMPFTGSWDGGFWNAQAYWAKDPLRQEKKWHFVERLLKNRDFLALGETHGTTGQELASSKPAGCEGFWAHGPSDAIGAGMWVKTAFLSIFRPLDRERDWQVIEAGRAGLLRLKGAKGNLDIVVNYGHTGYSDSVDLRNAMMRKLATYLQPASQTLTLMVGDWNFTIHDRDRMSQTTGNWVAEASNSARVFQEALARPYGLHEMEQDHPTHSSKYVLSRLDRCYTNKALADQQDHQQYCVLGPRPGLLDDPPPGSTAPSDRSAPRLSTHRPILFGSRRPPDFRLRPPRLSEQIFRHPDFLRKVEAGYHACLLDEPQATGIRRLVLLKRAIQNAAQQLEAQVRTTPSEPGSVEPLSAAMVLLRAAEQGKVRRMKEALRWDPALADLIDCDSQNFQTDGSLDRIREHIVQLAQEDVNRDFDALRTMDSTANEPHYTRRKENLIRKLRRLVPGSTQAMSVMEDEDGTLAVEPTRHAELLRRHWAKVFSAKQIDTHLLQQWLDDLNPEFPSPLRRPPELGFPRAVFGVYSVSM